MNKFKVGDKVRIGGWCSPKDVNYGKHGVITEVENGYNRIKFDAADWREGTWHNGYCSLNLTDKWLELLPSCSYELHITCNDGKTTNAVYKLNGKVEKTAKAVCCPSDTFDFNTGAGLAMNRVLGNIQVTEASPTQSAPKQDEPKYHAGDKVKIVANTCNHSAEVGEIVTLADNKTSHLLDSFKPAWHYEEYGGFISERDIEPYAEPSLTVTRDMLVKLGACSSGLAEFDSKFPSGRGEFEAVRDSTDTPNAVWLNVRKTMFEAMQNQPKQEVVTLYCVKDYTSLLGSHWLTKGKTYEFNGCGVTFNDGFCGSGERTFDMWKRQNPNISACLIRAEKRTAKKGEYILVTKSGDKRVKTGDICRFIDGGLCDLDIFVEHPDGKRVKDGAANISPSEYLVLPDYVPEKVEPTYLNMKVICTESKSSTFTAGYGYSVKDGFIYDDRKMPYNCSPKSTLKEINDVFSSTRFIEYRGEQSC